MAVVVVGASLFAVIGLFGVVLALFDHRPTVDELRGCHDQEAE